MAVYNTKAFGVHVTRAKAGTITVGDGGNAAQDLWANPHPRARVLLVLAIDSSFPVDSASKPDEAKAKEIANAVLRYSLSSSYTAGQTLRENHQWNGDSWVDVSASLTQFAYVFEIRYDSGGGPTALFHKAGLAGVDDDQARVRFCIAIQGDRA